MVQWLSESHSYHPPSQDRTISHDGPELIDESKCVRGEDDVDMRVRPQSREQQPEEETEGLKIDLDV